MTQPTTETKEYQLSKRTLKIIVILAILLGFVIRILTPGWILLIFGIPLLFVTLIHIIVQIIAIKSVARTRPAYAYLILLSNLFYFLAFVLQIDGGDAPEVYVPIIFRYPFPIESTWPDIFNLISLVSFVALFISWILLIALRNNVFKPKQAA